MMSSDMLLLSCAEITWSAGEGCCVEVRRLGDLDIGLSLLCTLFCSDSLG
jgi:hypothetical protein